LHQHYRIIMLEAAHHTNNDIMSMM